MVPKEQLTLAILAGGKASRLGGIDKGQLRYEGRALIDRLKDLQVYAAGTLVITEDVVPGKGAPVGGVTALTRSVTPYDLIVCCDQPRLTVQSVGVLLGAPPPAFFQLEQHLEPFPGVYLAAWASSWRARLAHNPSMREL